MVCLSETSNKKDRKQFVETSRVFAEKPAHRSNGLRRLSPHRSAGLRQPSPHWSAGLRRPSPVCSARSETFVTFLSTKSPLRVLSLTVSHLVCTGVREETVVCRAGKRSMCSANESRARQLPASGATAESHQISFVVQQNEHTVSLCVCVCI